jgi:hypothetical protein
MINSNRFLKPTPAVLAACFAFSFSTSALSAQSVQLDGYSVVPIKNGITQFDFGAHDTKGAKSRPGYIVLSRRENFNAHGFDLANFYAFGSGDGKGVLGTISFFDGDKEKFEASASGGADCLLHDFRLLESKKGKPPLLIVADRDPGDSYADEAAVTFIYFRLVENTSEDIGRPNLFFDRLAVRKVKKKYCDVGRAFEVELGLGPYNDSRQQ